MSITRLLDQLSQQGIRLWFEGSRLRFRSPRGALNAEQRVQLAERRDEAISALRDRAACEMRIAPLSYGQRSLWFVNQDESDSAAYNVAFAVHVESVVDRAALQDGFQALVDRHAILRTTYDVVDGQPSQRVAGGGIAAFEVQELPGLDDAALKAHIDADYHRPFDLRKGPVLRATLYSRGPEDHVLLLNAHHIALDGWSLLLLLEELRSLYVESTAGTPAALPRPELQYTDYADWQTQMLAGAEGARLAHYWQAKLAAPRAEVELPSDRPRPARKSVRGATFDFQLDAALTARLGQLARSEGTTMFVLLLAAFKILLFRYSGTEDIVVGTPMVGRSKPEFGRILGHFVNPVPLRSRLDAETSFRELTANLRQTLIEALENQEYPLALMVERLHPRRDPSRSPLFETMFVLQRFEQFRELISLLVVRPDDTSSDFGGLKVRPYDLHQQEGQFDLSLGLVDRGDTLVGAFKYNTDLFDAATMRQLAGHYRQLLLAIVEQPQASIGALPLLSTSERIELLDAAGGHGQPAEDASLVHRRFELQADRQPDAIALTCDNDHVSYAELNRRANRLAHRLIELGVRPDSLVGLFAERSIDLVVGLLGILKAGGAYLPIELAYPADRVAFMLEDAGAAVIVTQQHLSGRLPAIAATAVCVDDGGLSAYADENPSSRGNPDDLIYAIYTSGSTGRPKGTLMTHRAVDRLFQSTQAWYGFSSNDVWTLFHSVAFDFSVWELWGALIYGGRLVIVPYLTSRSPEEFFELLRREQVTVLNQTPSAFRQLVQADLASGPPRPTQLRHVIFGGEALELESLRPWMDRHGDAQPQLVNMYGITETCVHVTYRPITRADVDGGEGSVIGVPIPDLRVHVLDARHEPVPCGVPGEIYVGGPGLARGYLNRADLTEARFIPDPFVPAERLYRTGDLAKRRSNGELEYLGRIDQQVKIRGFRIELDEIESVLCYHPQVRDAVVVAISATPDENRLVAYVVANAPVPIVSDLREHLRKKVPDYMVPAAFVFLDKLPLTNSGKVDRNTLPVPDTADTIATEQYMAPVTETEKGVAQVFAEVLNIPAVGLHHNFFELGGHSLLATRALAMFRERFEIEIPLIALFEEPTVHGFSRWLDGAAERNGSVTQSRESTADFLPAWKCLVPTQSKGSNPPLFLVTGYMDANDTVRILSNLIPHLGPDQPLCGLRPRWLDGRSPQYSSVAEMADEYLRELRAFQPQGPYYLLGDCVGGAVAVEIAQALKEQGEEVALLVLLDAERPMYYSSALLEIKRLWERVQHMTDVLRQFVRPVEGTRRQVVSEVLERKLRRARLSRSPITTTDHIYEQRVAYQRLLKKHRLRRYSGHIKLIVSDDLYPFVRLLGWTGFADGGVEVLRTPGDHQTFRAQYSKEFGQQLRRCIDEARSVEQAAHARFGRVLSDLV